MLINNTDSAVRILLALTASPGLLVASALPGYHTACRRMSRVVGAAASRRMQQRTVFGDQPELGGRAMLAAHKNCL